MDNDRHRFADRWVTALDPKGWNLLPSVILLVSDPRDILYRRGSAHRNVVKNVASHGYKVREWVQDATACGAAVDQQRWVTAFTLHEEALIRPPREAPLPPRPMRNLLSPPGLVPRHLWSSVKELLPAEMEFPSGQRGARVVGQFGTNPPCRVYDIDSPMPVSHHAYVADPHRGVRPILAIEFAKALGHPDARSYDKAIGLPTPLSHATSLHIWHSLLDVLPEQRFLRGHLSVPQTAAPANQPGPSAIPSPPDWAWQLPDLSEDSAWFVSRIATLNDATAAAPDRDRLRSEGLATLRRYIRTLMGQETTLNLLWWEWPPTHWERIRNGCSLNFIVSPEGGLVPNPAMDADQMATAVEFVEELIDINVLEAVPDGQVLLRNGPLLVIPKAGQPGQWRVLSDMKRGGQNAYIANDPVLLPRLVDILPALCPGGYLAVVDVSKEFYHFPTRPDERPYLGLIHPSTGKHYWYRGIPMGSSSSPGVAGQGVAALLRDLLRNEVFQGRVVVNDITNHLVDAPYRSDWPEGRFCVNARGEPVPALWIHVDDFLISGPTYAATEWLLNILMDHLVRLGLLAHKKKVKPPGQTQVFCGFEYDVRGTPLVRIPADKRDNAQALIQFLERGRARGRLSRLTLAIIIGKLQSMVPATAGNVGATFLHNLYSVLHEADPDSQLTPSDVSYYYRLAHMTPQAWDELSWWREYLSRSDGALVRARDSAVLVSTWGDGSGTGSGGTVQFSSSQVPTPDELEMWMGVWLSRARSFTSNWKELYTLLRTLQRDRFTGRLNGRHVFYFTDNLVSYHVVQRGSSRVASLHRLVRELKLLCAELCIILEVVHVPGDVMIRQGGDGLSRGLWMPPHPHRLTPREEVARVFQAAVLTDLLLRWALRCRELWVGAPSHATWVPVSLTEDWHPDLFMNRSTLWTPPPRVASQALWVVLQAWVEFPQDTEALFFIPRICTRSWTRVHKAICTIGFLRSGAVWDGHVPWDQSEIPLVLLYLPPHRRTLPPPSRESDNLVAPPLPADAGWHRAQAQRVRGL